MHVRVCGWCAAPFQLLDKGPSSPSNPTHSHSPLVCIPPKGGGKGKGKKGPKQHPKKEDPAAPPKGKGVGGNAGGPQQKRERDSSVGSIRSQGLNGNFWQRRAAAAAKEKSTKVDPPAPVPDVAPMESEELPASEEAQELLEHMDTVQAMLNSLAGRNDAYSAATRGTLEKELGSLRIQRTKTKSLTAQVAVLEALISRRTSAIAEAECAILDAQQHCSTLKQELVEVNSQLLVVQALKMQEDVAKVPPLVANALGPISLLTHAQGMSALLPPEKAALFSECIGLLAQMMAPQVGAAPPPATVTIDLVAQAAAEATAAAAATSAAAAAAAAMDASLFAHQNGLATFGSFGSAAASSAAAASSFTPVTPTGKGSHMIASSDPYARATSPARRGRTQSAAPSPQQRSRSSSATGGRRLRCKMSGSAILALGPAIAPFPIVPVTRATTAAATIGVQPFSCGLAAAANLS